MSITVETAKLPILLSNLRLPTIACFWPGVLHQGG